jgi:hypothetical protein
MGYDLHITRKTNWFDPGGKDIPLPEWLAFVHSDPEMRLDGFAEATTSSGETLRIESSGLCVWAGYSKHVDAETTAWFDFHHGCVVVKDPDAEIRRKMYEVAVQLQARVQGDEGEFYDAQGQSEP